MCTSRVVGQVHDFSFLSALARACPCVVTFLDLGITEFTSVKVTVPMFLAFSFLPRLPVFTATSLDDLSTTMMTFHHRTVIQDNFATICLSHTS